MSNLIDELENFLLYSFKDRNREREKIPFGTKRMSE